MNFKENPRCVVSISSRHNETIENLALVAEQAKEELLSDILTEWAEDANPSPIRSNILDELKAINAHLEWIETHLSIRPFGETELE